MILYDWAITRMLQARKNPKFQKAPPFPGGDRLHTIDLIEEVERHDGPVNFSLIDEERFIEIFTPKKKVKKPRPLGPKSRYW